MIPYNYRRLLRRGFHEEFCQALWPERWSSLKQIILDGLARAVAIDVSPILHILNRDSEEAESTNLYPPWWMFYFEKPFSLDESTMRRLFENRNPLTLEQEVAKHKNEIRMDGILVGVCKANSPAPGVCESFRRYVPDGYVYQAMGINYPPKSKAIVTYLFLFGVTSQGNLYWNPESRTVNIQRLIPTLPGIKHDEVVAQLNQDMQADVHAICRFVRFMQARNITVKRKHFPDYKPRKHHHDKIYKYYELTVVKPSINPIAPPYNEGGKGKALHTVRGHIRRYKPDRPLFGISGLHGDFFIEQHARGKMKYGKVEKTYRTKEQANVVPMP